jgi:hypothetical protein
MDFTAEKHIRAQVRKILSENHNVEIPDIPGTMNFWHGGNLDNYDDIIAQKNGRYEYGPGLYITTSYDVATRYSKGSRKLYLVTIEKGKDIQDSYLSLDSVKDFMSKYVVSSKRKEILLRLEKFTDGENMVPADVFNNNILNSKGIKSTNIRFLREFYVSNGIDYELVFNPFGWGEDMIVLYNMNKIVNTIQVKPGDRFEYYDLKKKK